MPDVAKMLQALQRHKLMAFLEKTNEWQLSHSLLESVIYTSMLEPRRTAIHLRIGEALESITDNALDARAGEVGYHFQKAHQSLRALDYFVAAGEWAVMCSGVDSAIYYFEQAAEIATKETAIPDGIRCRICTGLGDVYQFSGRYEEAIAVLNAGLALAETISIDACYHASLFRRLGETAQRQGNLEVARQYFKVSLSFFDHPTGQSEQIEKTRSLLRLAWSHFLQGDVSMALRIALSGLEEASEAESLRDLAMAENLLGGIYHRSGDLVRSIEHTQRALSLREQLGYTWGVASINSNLGILAVADGQWVEAEAYFETSLHMRERFGDIEGVVISRQNLAMLYRDMGDLVRANECFQQGLQIAADRGMGYHIVTLCLGLAEVLSMQGLHDQAQEMWQQGKQQAQQVDSRDLLAEACYVEAELLLGGSKHAEAYQRAQHAAMLAADAGAKRLQAAACRLASSCALQLDKLPQAHLWLAKARSALDEVTDQLELGRIKSQSGLVHLAEGDIAQATDLLLAARKLFVALGAKRDLGYLEQQLAEKLGPEFLDSNSLRAKSGHS